MQLDKGMVSHTYLENGIVSKQYLVPFHKYTPRNIKAHWDNEIKALKLLRGKKHFPQLISVDYANRIIYMSYCGDPLRKENLPEDWKKQCTYIEKTLCNLYIYPQDFIGKDANLTPPHNKNIHVKDGIIYLIDFGIWSTKHTEGFNTITDIVKQLA
ncbi:hypothetical protein LCGC14_0388600 [marine sediment metagenome]|uniref:Protein kinase domain-containing protein n=1 Tax=marine sediment metagenome TaxID=412755 RepID=A0A0F9W9A1_9ZZZZ